ATSRDVSQQRIEVGETAADLDDQHGSNGIQARKLEPGPLIPAKAYVERLHGLARRPLHQVVKRAHDYHPPGVWVAFEADVAVVRPRQDLWIGIDRKSTRLNSSHGS